MNITDNLHELQRYLERVRDDSFVSVKDAKEIGARLHDLVMRSFETSTDPYGKKWAPIKHRKGQPLRDTGILMNSINFESKKGQLKIGTNVEYASYHNLGTNHIKQRMYIPTDSNKLPDSYNNVIIDVITRKLEQAIQ